MVGLLVVEFVSFYFLTTVCFALHSNVKEHPKRMFLPHCERPSFTPTSNNKLNYISAYLNIYIFDSKLEDQTFCTE